MKKSFLFLRVIFILILLCAFQTFAQTCGTPNNINQNEVDGPIPLGTRWALYQTFTPDCNGIVDNITVWHKSTTAYTANVFLRQGANPVGSDILDNFTFTFPASPSGASQNVIDFSSTANLTAGQTYAFAFVFSNGDDIGFDFRAADPYPDGTLYWIEESTSSWENAIGGAVDLRFRVNWVDQSPYVTCREGRSFALGADGTVDISFSQVSAGSGPSDGESVLIRSINPSSFDCDDIGPQTVSLTVQDTSGQNAFCSTTITITDGEDPKLTCPDDITVNIDPFVPAIITYDAPTVDDCTASTLTQTAGLPSGSVFPVGTTTNTFEAVDAYGNVGTCSFDVTVVENPFEVLVELDNGTLRITDIGDTSDINLTITENVGGNAFFLSDLPPAQISTGINRLTSSLLWVTIADITNGIEFIGGNGNNSITIDSDISINGDFDIKNINTFTQNGAITITGAFKVSESITLDLKIRRALTAQSLDITGIYSLKDQSPGYPITVSGTTNIQTAEDVDLSLGATAPHVFGGLVNINAFNFSLASSQSIELGTIIATDSDNIRRNEIYVGSGNLTLTADIVTAGDSDLYLRAEESINQSSGIVVTDHLFFDGSNDEDTIALFFGNNDIDMIEVETGRTMELIVFNDIDDMEIGLLNIGDASLFAPTMNLTENTNIFKNGTGSLTIGSDTSTINITNSTTNTVANIEHNAGLVEFFGSTITVEKLDYQGASGTRTRFLDGNTTFNDLDLSLEFGTLAIQAPVNIGSSGINIEVLDELLIDKFNGVLSGTGTFTGISTTVELDGTIAPGNGTTPSTLTIQSVEFDEGTFAPYIDTDSAFDQLNVVGTVTLTDADFAPTGDFSIDDANIGVITLINNDGVDAVVGTFNGLAEGAQVTLPGTSEDFTISYVGGDGNDVILIRESTFAPVIICPPDITLECGTAIGLGVSSDTPIDIPDNDDTGITSIANVSGLDASFQVIDITVQTAMNHTWIGDLAMEVTAPGGESVVLFAESLAESSDLNATFPITFTDSATVPANDIGETIDNIEAVCQVDNICEYTAMGGTDAFAQLISEINANGSPINGDWTLSIRDQVFQDTGTLVSWQVKIVALNPNPDPTDPAATGTATATDTQGTPTITYSDVVVSGDCGNTGTTERTWTATDADANVSTCVQTITVTDTTAPVVTSCPEDIVFEIAEGETEAIITYDLPEATDLCGDATITQTEGLASGASFPEGVTTNTFSITDVCGNETICSFTVTAIIPETEHILVSPKVYLQGASLNPNSGQEGWMRDDLRVADLLPIASPYGDLSADANAFSEVEPNNSIVDWVWVELRDAADDTNIIAGRSALVQRDGDVVDVDGSAPVRFESVSSGNYYVVIKHRNHVGIMSSTAVSLSDTETGVDLSSDPSVVQGGTNSVVMLSNGKYGMYSGDYDGNTQIQNTDAVAVVQFIGTSGSGYEIADMDLNTEIQNADVNALINPNIGRGEQFGRPSVPTEQLSTDVTLAFANAQITNDGVDDYYEADIVISGTTDFYVGSGQVYLDYATAAFGENISANGNIEYSQPDGSILGYSFGAFSPAYRDFIENDNITSRVSLSFQQNVGLTGLETAPELQITSTPKVLFHIKIRYENAAEDAGMCFYSDGIFQDQFFTACGGAATADCTNTPGVQITNDTYDCSEAGVDTLGITEITDSPILLYPNPASTNFRIKGLTTASHVRVYDVNGRLIIEERRSDDRPIDMSAYDDGVYLVKITSDSATATKRLIKKAE